LAISADAQNYSFIPSSSVTSFLNLGEYKDTQIDIDPQSSDTYAMSWRMVGNTCPESWDIVLCDWSECYTFLPNNGDMDPIFPGQVGLLKLTVNPFETAGSGYVRFWVYPTGNIDLHQDVYFYYETTFTALTELGNYHPSIVYEQNGKSAYVNYLEAGNYKVFNMGGQLVSTFFCSDTSLKLDLTIYPKGVFILSNEKNIFLKLIVQ